MTMNAALAGLVAVTAGCDAVSIGGAAIIGIAAGLLLPISVNFFDSALKIDDPVGAISVHGVCGAQVPCSPDCWQWTAVCSTAAASISSAFSAWV